MEATEPCGVPPDDAGADPLFDVFADDGCDDIACDGTASAAAAVAQPAVSDLRSATLAECCLSASKSADLERRRARRGKAPIADGLPIVNRRSALCRRVRLSAAFNGAGFHGWMRQPGLRTLQEVLEGACGELLGQRIRAVPAGRTDAGVHALAQVVQFDAILGDLPVEDLVPQLNARLPGDLHVHDMKVAGPDFNVMVTRWKRYVYRLCSSEHDEAPLLDVARMQAAADLLIGTRDYAGFQSRGGRSSTVRTMYRCEVTSRTRGCVVLLLEADGFLKHMCRIVVGTLVEVGFGLHEPSRVETVLATGDRAEAGPTFPAIGLCLEHVEHAREWSRGLSESMGVAAAIPGIGTEPPWVRIGAGAGAVLVL